MRRINLLPPELAEKRRTRQLLGGMVAAGVGLIVLLVLVYVGQQARLSSQKDRLTEQERRNGVLQRQVAQLGQFSRQQDELKRKELLLNAITKNEVLWSSILTELSLVIPPDDWLTNFTGTLVAGTGGPSTPGVAASIGSLQVNGCTLVPPDGDHLNVAQFLVEIAKPLSFSDDPFLTLTAKGESTCPIQFNAQIQLTDDARRARQPGRERRI